MYYLVDSLSKFSDISPPYFVGEELAIFGEFVYKLLLSVLFLEACLASDIIVE